MLSLIFLIYGAIALGVNLGMTLWISIYGPIAFAIIILTWLIVWLARVFGKNKT